MQKCDMLNAKLYSAVIDNSLVMKLLPDQLS
jgi:hypothetical protein